MAGTAMMKTRITIGGTPGAASSTPSSAHTSGRGTAPSAAAAFQGFPREGLGFLANLQENNNKAWFDANRAGYDAWLLAPMRAFVAELGTRLQEAVSPTINCDTRVGGSIMRMNRDTRFSHDKTPYKNHVGAWFWEGEAKSMECPGYYMALNADKLILGAGKHSFEGSALGRYREAVASNEMGPELERAVKTVREAGPYDVDGEHYKRVPGGYDADHPRGALLKHAGLHAGITVPVPAEAHSRAFLEYCVGHYYRLSPIVDWLKQLDLRSEV
jgi:uncharacterized protein (TIGR02453 family)